MARPLFELPKAHLHLHLEGGMRHQTLVDLAEVYGMDVPVVSGFGSFTAFADMYVAACDVLQTPEDLLRLCEETVLDAVEAGATYIEPSIYLPHHRERIGPDEETLEILIDGFEAASARHGVAWGLMVAADRTADPELASEQARIAVRYRDRGIVSFGLANDEVIGPPGEFADAYDIARAGGLLSTPHAGELCGPESVRAALDILGADRLQHGVRAVEDPKLVERLAEQQICCDVCPTSNVLLSVVDSLAVHQLPELLAAGVPCSVNADDPLLFGPGLLHEYEVCRSDMGLSDAQLASVARSSFQFSGAPQSVKNAAFAGIDEWLAGSGA